mgnify:CR=1 FL=1|tara:strand:- start:28 stop:372 length:345 start_codon:yes stop_codon:yes gene_type:complete
MIKGVEGRVRHILTNFHETRDDDMKLFGMIIYDFYNMSRNLLESKTGFELMGKIFHSKVPHFTSVLRCRQKLQEQCPDLRGKKYNDRKKHAEKVKQELKAFESEDGQGDLFNGA